MSALERIAALVRRPSRKRAVALDRLASGPADWQQTDEQVETFVSELPGVVHLRTYRRHAHPPVVIVGQFSDHRVPLLRRSACDIAATIQASVFPDGQPWRFIEYLPIDLGAHYDYPVFREIVFGQRHHDPRKRHAPPSGLPQPEITATATIVDTYGSREYHFLQMPPATREWTFYDARLLPAPLRIAWPDAEWPAVDELYPGSSKRILLRPAKLLLPDLLDNAPVAVWNNDAYTVSNVSGKQTGQLAHHVKTARNRITDAQMDLIDAWASADDHAIRHLI